MREYVGSHLYRYVEQKFGTKVTLYQNRASVGNTPSIVVKNNPRRLYMLIVNNSDTYVTLSFMPNVSWANGVVLPSNGGSLTLTADEDGEAVGYAMYGITLSGTIDLDVFEGVAE